jgi:hypothetical protein
MRAIKNWGGIASGGFFLMRDKAAAWRRRLNALLPLVL